MADSWLSEIRMFPYTKIPTGWHLCDGTILQITENQALFSLLGNRYGGDGQKTFGLPDMRGRVPVHMNQANADYAWPGKAGGVDTVALSTTQIPSHNHSVNAFSAVGNFPLPVNAYPAGVANNPIAGAPPTPQIYSPPPTGTGNTTTLDPGSVAAAGGTQGHENRQPTMALNWCICVSGYYPARN